MKWYLPVLMVILISCKKDNQSAGMPDGVWVDKNRPLDTIVTYRENRKNILFDNSEMYRSVSSRLPNNDSYKWKYKLNPGKIGITSYSQAAEVYFSYDFTWITEGQEFSITANAVRPYLSSTGIKLVYRKVK